ncbi:uncharacterized protein LOC115887628 [Sitophilus oryzae]|uniref:Uncharacterized protein LOC115887628 n=1 Tax=Sitophilus oryzae TaxID=7048 RepID=A0A6J2YII9_SITOR|nr:uncharacterized protein LOC115887628 [Sitophilus oryzae]
MTCLPFGLSTAPLTFGRVSNWLAQVLRSHGVRVIVYLDDFMLASQSLPTLQTQLRFTLDLFFKLGWEIRRKNVEKTQKTPQQVVQFLGITWNTKNGAISLPGEKVSSLKKRSSETNTNCQMVLEGCKANPGKNQFCQFCNSAGSPKLKTHADIISHPSRMPFETAVRHAEGGTGRMPLVVKKPDEIKSYIIPNF